MNTSTMIYTTAVLPAIIASNNSSHIAGNGDTHIGIFGCVFITIFCFGIIGICTFMAFDLRDRFSIFFASFLSLLIFMMWLGAIFGLK